MLKISYIWKEIQKYVYDSYIYQKVGSGPTVKYLVEELLKDGIEFSYKKGKSIRAKKIIILSLCFILELYYVACGLEE